MKKSDAKSYAAETIAPERHEKGHISSEIVTGPGVYYVRCVLIKFDFVGDELPMPFLLTWLCAELQIQ